jgi:hypothetical protein
MTAIPPAKPAEPLSTTASGLVVMLDSAGRTVEHLYAQLEQLTAQLNAANATIAQLLAERDARDVPPPT